MIKVGVDSSSGSAEAIPTRAQLERRWSKLERKRRQQRQRQRQPRLQVIGKLATSLLRQIVASVFASRKLKP